MKGPIARLGLIVLPVAALIAAVVASASARPVATPTVNFVNGGAQDFTTGDILYFVDLMKKQGINVNFQNIPDAAATLRSVVAGQSDIVIASFPTAINAVINGGAKIKIIASNNQATDYVLVAQKGITMQNIAGKTLAIDTPGSAGHLISKIAIQKAGFDPDAPRYVTIGSSSARLTAVLAGRVDIAPLHYPLALNALDNPNIVQLLDGGKSIGPYLQSGLVASDTFLKNKALAQKVVNAFINAQRWAASNKFRYISLMQQAKITDGLNDGQQQKVWDYFKNVSFFGVNGGICFDHVTRFAQLNWTIGSLPKPLPGRKDWLDDSFVKTYLKAHKQKPTTC
jgi:ABC-type nitrate/sulfonate/bicarbonate transport system substrate-binding protein